MALNNMKVFNEYVREATIETVAQMVEKFNAASNGGIQLSTQGFDGDFFLKSCGNKLDSLSAPAAAREQRRQERLRYIR